MLFDVGDVFDFVGWYIEVVDLDGCRIDKILVSWLSEVEIG